MLLRLNDITFLCIAIISEYNKILANSVLLYTYQNVSESQYEP